MPSDGGRVFGVQRTGSGRGLVREYLFRKPSAAILSDMGFQESEEAQKAGRQEETHRSGSGGRRAFPPEPEAMPLGKFRMPVLVSLHSRGELERVNPFRKRSILLEDEEHFLMKEGDGRNSDGIPEAGRQAGFHPAIFL